MLKPFEPRSQAVESERLIRRVHVHLDHLCGDGDGAIGVAVSGGSDSTALLHLARSWAERRHREIFSLSLDHGLRPESAAEVAHVKAMSAAMGCPSIGLKLMMPGAGQASLRDARHRTLCQASTAHGISHLLFGHTYDDQLETCLLRLRQGSHWYGLGGIDALAPAPVWPDGQGLVYARPVLGESRALLRQWLNAQGATWIEDPSNRNSNYERVRLRTRLGAEPWLRAHMAKLHGRFASLRLAEQRGLMTTLNERVEVDADNRIRFAFDGLQRDHVVRVFGVLLQIAGHHARPVSTRQVQRLVDALSTPKAFRGQTLARAWVRPCADHKVLIQSAPAARTETKTSGLDSPSHRARLGMLCQIWTQNSRFGADFINQGVVFSNKAPYVKMQTRNQLKDET